MAEHLYRKRISPASGSNVDDLVSKNVLAQLRRDPPPRPPAPGHADHPKPGTRGSSHSGGAASGGSAGSAGSMAMGGGVEAPDLISSMAKRLGALEREMKERQSILQQVQADNVMLKSKLKVAEEEIAKRALAAIEPRDDSAAVMHLRAENSRLRAQLKYAWKQVAEMKAFLNDYGMVWMGEPEVEAELVAQGFGPVDIANAGAVPSGARQGSLQSLSPEPSDPLAPRRSSHSGAAPGPSSAAAAAAAAALGRAGEGGSGATRPGSAAVGKRSSSFTAASAPAASTASPASAAPSRPPSSLMSPRSATAATGPPASASAQAVSPRRAAPVNFAELLAKVEELNDLAGDGCGHVIRDAGGQHVLAMQDPVNLVIYRDGLQIHTLPAKPFSDPASNAVLRDILDGYFPYVLKRDFPDGVPLRLVDRTTESYAGTPPKHGGAAGSAGVSGRAGNIRTFDDIDGHSGGPEPMSRDKFLSRLPQAVIKNGKVIEIRSDISKMLGGGGGAGGSAAGDGGKADVALISTPVDALLSTLQRNHLGPSLPPPSRDGQPPATEVTTLQVKSIDGKQTYILKFKYDDTIGTLRSCIDAHHAKAGQSGVLYEIRSAFPVRAYTDVTETLRQAGLVPNATLFLRAV